MAYINHLVQEHSISSALAMKKPVLLKAIIMFYFNFR